jgi:hypothetical protein
MGGIECAGNRCCRRASEFEGCGYEGLRAMTTLDVWPGWRPCLVACTSSRCLAGGWLPALHAVADSAHLLVITHCWRRSQRRGRGSMVGSCVLT